MKQAFKKHLRIITGISVFFFSAFLLFSYSFMHNLRFKQFTNELFQNEMYADTLSMHYILAYPENYGISPTHAALTPYQAYSEKEAASQMATVASVLDSFHPLFFSKENRLLFTLLEKQFAMETEMTAYPYYAEPLSPASGIQTTLPVLLAEYTFRTRQDVENYLSLLSDIPDYLEGIARYETEKAQAGLFMESETAHRVIHQCRQIMDARQLMKDKHFLNITFSERLQSLLKNAIITPEEAALYEKQNHRLLLDNIMPAYESLADSLSSLSRETESTGSTSSFKKEHALDKCAGLARLPKGKEYYTLLLEQSTGCNRKLSDIRQLLEAQLRHDSKALFRLSQKHPEIASLSLDDYFPKSAPIQYLQDLQNRMASDFPPYPKSDVLPKYVVKEVSPSLEPYCAPAFYLTPPIDDISQNSIYINGKDSPDKLELYTTLAHEGYPGHLYQTVYHQLSRSKHNTLPARSLLHYGGYVEGWALYVEMRSYDYAKELLSEQNAPPQALDLCEAIRLNRSIQLCLYSLLDIYIHHDGFSETETQSFLSKFGISNTDTIHMIYTSIAEEPTNYPKYYVGYLEFLLLKKAAMETWQQDYSDLRFHKFILDMGPCPFSFLQKNFSSKNTDTASPAIPCFYFCISLKYWFRLDNTFCSKIFS